MSGTPILDLEREPPTPRSSLSPSAVIAWLLVGCGAAALSGKIAIDPIWILPALVVGIAAHEFGHLLGARLAGIETGGIAICGLLFYKSGDRWLWRFDWRMMGGGFVKPLLRDGQLRRGAYAALIAGGPLATLLMAASAGLAQLVAASDPTWLTVLLWINVFILAASTIPSLGPQRSDIPRLWQLWWHPAAFRAQAAALHVQAEEAAGVMPRDWKAEFADVIAEPDWNARSTASLQMLAFYRSIDIGDQARALAHLENALAASGAAGRVVRHWCFLEAACSSAILRGNPAAARGWLTRAGFLQKPESTASIEAAIAQAEGRYGDAVNLWDQALVFIECKRPDSGLARYAKVKITEYRSQCRQALARQSQGNELLAPSE